MDDFDSYNGGTSDRFYPGEVSDRYLQPPSARHHKFRSVSLAQTETQTEETDRKLDSESMRSNCLRDLEQHLELFSSLKIEDYLFKGSPVKTKTLPPTPSKVESKVLDLEIKEIKEIKEPPTPTRLSSVASEIGVLDIVPGEKTLEELESKFNEEFLKIWKSEP